MTRSAGIDRGLGRLFDRCLGLPDAGARSATGDDAVAGRQPGFVVAPATVSAVAEVVKLAVASQARIVVRGGGTKLATLGRPAGCDLLLDTRRLAGVIEHRHDEFVATIASGTTLAAADQVLGRRGQWTGLDPADPGRATIGGVFSANDGGPRRHRLGAPRDRILACRFVRADGAVIRAGVPVVKNVAGYDLARLMTGTAGAFGVIVDVSLRLAPIPAASRTVILEFDAPISLTRLLHRLVTSTLEPTSVELSYPPLRLLVRFETVGDACDDQVVRLAALAAAQGAEVREVAPHEERGVWEEQTQSPCGRILMVIAAPPPLLVDVIAPLGSLPSGCTATARGPIGWGELRVGLTGDDDAVLQGAGWIAGMVEQAGGWCRTRSSDPDRATTELVAAAPSTAPAASLLSTLRSVLDPLGILNPGIGAGR